MKRIFLVCLFFLVCSSAGAKQRSQAIDLLEYDLANLKIVDQDIQNNFDNWYKYFFRGGLCFLLSYYATKKFSKRQIVGQGLFMPIYKAEPDFADLLLGGVAVYSGAFGCCYIIWFLQNLVWKNRIKRKIIQITKQISHLKGSNSLSNK